MAIKWSGIIGLQWTAIFENIGKHCCKAHWMTYMYMKCAVHNINSCISPGVLTVTPQCVCQLKPSELNDSKQLTNHAHSAFKCGTSVAGTDLCLVSVRPGIPPLGVRSPYKSEFTPLEASSSSPAFCTVLNPEFKSGLWGAQQSPSAHWGRAGGNTDISF